MAEKDYNLKFFGARSKFVYYDSLQQTHPLLYQKVLDEKIRHDNNHETKMLQVASDLKRYASVEGAKEIALLKKFFNVDLDLSAEDLYTNDIGIKIVNAINTSLQFRDAYNRHLTRIVGKNGKSHAKITAAQFFKDYFSSKFYDIVSKKLKEIVNITDYTIEQLGEILFSDENINEALYQAFFDTERSLRASGDWSKNDTKHGYEEMFDSIEKFNKDSFLREVSQAYKLSELKQRLMETIKTTEQVKEIFSGKPSSAKGYVKKSLKESTVAKGTLAEIIGEKVANSLVAELNSRGSNINFSSKVIGKAGGKADIVMTFNLDMEKILDVVDKHYRGREETIDAYKELNRHLARMDDSFIVYTNAKDYSLIKDKGDGSYFFKGFSAGEAISLGTLEGVIERTPGGSADIVGQIMNTLDGAVWAGKQGELEAELCSKMAYLLFDDVMTIGKTTAAGSRAIHLTLLDGVYIPLSYMFYLMADAIKDVSQNPDEIFDINIESGSIKYPNPPWKPGMWVDQRDEAYEQIKISARFLSNFADIVSRFR